MEALVMAGGKGSRMCPNGVEKPFIKVGEKHVIEQVINALRKAKTVNRILVTVSPNTKYTEQFLKDIGVETLRTSGEDYVGDLHSAYEVMNGKYVFSTPSDMPLLRPITVDNFINAFNKEPCDSFLAVVDEDTVLKSGIKPSFALDIDGKRWVLSGFTILHREAILRNEQPVDHYLKTDWIELAVNVNTMHELQMARMYFNSDQ